MVYCCNSLLLMVYILSNRGRRPIGSGCMAIATLGEAEADGFLSDGVIRRASFQ